MPSSASSRPEVTDESDLYCPRQIVQPVPGLDGITPEHEQQFAELGFVSVAKVFTPAQVDDARDALTDLIMGRCEEFDGVEFEAHAAEKLDELGLAERELAVRKLMDFVAFDDRLQALAAHRPLLELVAKLMGQRKPRLFQDMALLKPPGGREKPWHQDKAYFDIAVDEPVVGLWIALDDASLDAGCMHLIPGSHRDGPVIHFRRRDWQICDTEVRQDQVAAPLEPGGVLIFDGLIHHGTPPNRTDGRRRALQYHYAPEDARWTDTQARLKHFGSEGRDVSC